MIRPLRRRHLWMVLAIAVVVLVAFFAALASRPEPAIQDELPDTTGASLLLAHPPLLERYRARVVLRAVRWLRARTAPRSRWLGRIPDETAGAAGLCRVGTASSSMQASWGGRAASREGVRTEALPAASDRARHNASRSPIRFGAREAEARASRSPQSEQRAPFAGEPASGPGALAAHLRPGSAPLRSRTPKHVTRTCGGAA